MTQEMIQTTLHSGMSITKGGSVSSTTTVSHVALPLKLELMKPATQQWVFLDWLDASWPPPVAPAQPRRDSLHPRPSRRGNPVEGTYDKVNPTPHSNYEQLDPCAHCHEIWFLCIQLIGPSFLRERCNLLPSRKSGRITLHDNTQLLTLEQLFAILFTESAGANALNRITDYNTALSRGIDHTALSKVKYNEVVHTQVRRFIVVKNKREFCYAVYVTFSFNCISGMLTVIARSLRIQGKEPKSRGSFRMNMRSLTRMGTLRHLYLVSRHFRREPFAW